MFGPEEILTRLRTRPFRPLRIIASEGLRFDIRHPDLVMVGHRDITIGHELPGVPGVYNRITQLALIHIVGIEEISVEPSAVNGTAG